MPDTLIAIAYIAASALFIMSLGGLSNQETARRGNWFGIIGMVIALIATAARPGFSGYGVLVAMLIAGTAIGAILAARVKMTAMPQLVAILHSFVGLAAVLVGIATYLGPHPKEPADLSIHLVEIFLGVCIGSVTFTGSIIAFGKLQGFISGNPVLIPGRHLINLAMVGAVVWFGVQFHHADGTTGLWPLLIATGIAGILGVHFVMAIGGADMPVVVSMLNSYSGWAAAAAGFMLANDLLIITGALVGSSGAILSFIMCRGMNRSFVSVILGGFGTASGNAVRPAGAGPAGEVRSIDAIKAADQLRQARKVVIVPGYGLAVAQAQYAISTVAQILRDRGTHVRFAIHPVAGRLPGHMNVLLAEANVPYDIVHEMEEINQGLHEVDAVLVIGANDIVNPSALEDPSSPIAGMPVLEVWRARTVIVMKRGMASGYAGVENPLFFRENTVMLFGDARLNVEAILGALRN